MSNLISIDSQRMPIHNKDFVLWCENMRKRIIRILYLKDDLVNGDITQSDIRNYINSLIWDLYGAYIIFTNYNFLSCICELEGLKNNISDEFSRKKILDLASFMTSISKRI